MKRVLRDVAGGKISPEKALEEFRHLPTADLGFSRLDTHRALRTGTGEVVFCPGKTTEQVIAIMKKLTALGQNAIATRADAILYQAVRRELPAAKYFAQARIIAVGKFPKPRGRRTILVVSAGTSDIPVAEEAAVTAELLGSRVERLYDVGVAGIHRLFRDMKRLHDASVLIVVAGMEGALASVVGGLVSKPVIAVPTSVGYGASFHGISALLTMLNSCAPGIATVNIDNGFGAGFLAHRILTLR
jgi:pyridinium-3,5-biscarboxylic acid mononucleotide synthase